MVSQASQVVRAASDEVLQEHFRHDLRQPLVAVSLLVDALVRTDDLEQVALRLAEVQRLVDWALLLLREQEEEGAVQVVDIGETIADHCTAGAYDCLVRFIETAPARIVVNPVDLTRAVRNLLDNALRASSHGGSVEVAISRDGPDAVLEVSDSGPGFGRLAPMHGHGLVEVRRFAERYGGRLQFGSSQLGGAAVSLRLPLALGPWAA